jgi:hypothetical protein
MRKKLRVIISWLAFAGLSSCLGSSSDPAPQVYTSVAITHCAPSCPSLNFFVDDVSIGSTAILYKDYSGYLFLDPGTRNLKFKSSVDGTLLINTTMTFEQFKGYSVFLTTTSPGTCETWLVEDVGMLSSLEKCMVRFANLSPDAPTMTLTIVENSMTLPAKSYKEITSFIEMEPKSYTLEVRAASDGQLILSKPFQPASGSFYTISLVGYQTPPANNTNHLELIIKKA